VVPPAFVTFQKKGNLYNAITGVPVSLRTISLQEQRGERAKALTTRKILVVVALAIRPIEVDFATLPTISHDRWLSVRLRRYLSSSSFYLLALLYTGRGGCQV